jgi:hypothetical protein
MRRVVGLILCLSLLLTGVTPSVATAAPTDPKNKGLYISPLRSYVAFGADDQVTRAITVANLTDKPITVALKVEEFSVVDYTYDYLFDEPNNNWVQFVEKSIELKPYQSHEAAYRISIPRGAAPGGHYYTLFASADLSQAGFEGTVRAASLIYLTVDGAVRRTAAIKDSSSPRIIISPQIPYTLDVKNTGNIHYFAYFSASVDGLFYHKQPTGTSQLLMPGSSRQIKNTIPSPFIPGIYKFTYGLVPDQVDPVQISRYIVIIPPWFIAALVIIGYFLVRLWQRRKRRRADKVSESATDS